MIVSPTSVDPENGDRVTVVSTDPGLGAAEAVAWTEIEAGRYQPRRIRGSCLGRELG